MALTSAGLESRTARALDMAVVFMAVVFMTSRSEGGWL